MIQSKPSRITFIHSASSFDAASLRERPSGRIETVIVQLELFSTADVIAAADGAALASLMFRRPGTKMLEFFPANYLDDCYCRLRQAMGLVYHKLFGGNGDFPKMASVMGPVDLEAAIRAMLEE